jgi:hypothetical protein
MGDLFKEVASPKKGFPKLCDAGRVLEWIELELDA